MSIRTGNDHYIKSLCTLILLCIFSESAYSQKDTSRVKKYALGGYIVNMQAITFESIRENWINDNVVHNRLNFNYFPNKSIYFGFGLRNRIFTGESQKIDSSFAKSLEQDAGFLNLSKNLIHEKSFILNTFIDRCYLNYSKGKVVATIGRQRINWGQCLVWNPNDIFNTYSYYDVDYDEKPGSDAIRVQYNTNSTCVAELAIKADHDNKTTFAAYYKFNKNNFDIQLLGGMIAQSDYFIGSGWTGYIKNIGLRSEFQYIRSKLNFKDTLGYFISSIGLDYTFSNTLAINFETLYNAFAGNDKNFNFIDYLKIPVNVKNLSFSKWNYFGQVSGQVTPLFNACINGTYFPNINGFFFGISLSYSLSDNLSASLRTQTFSEKIANRDYLNFVYIFCKYSF